MNMRPKLRTAALVGAIAAVAASAWATNEPRYTSAYVPDYRAESTIVTASEPLAVSDTLSPNESIVVHTDYSESAVPDSRVYSPPILVEERRLTEDERIQAEVMDRLATNSRLDGKIGVESRDSVVRLSGWTRTVGQARHAERDARSVYGVKYVQNEIRPRVGGSV